MEIIEGTIASPKGYKANGIHAGLKKRKKDMGWIISDVVASAAGVYTTNQLKAAPLRVTKAAINENHQLQALVVNSAIANACTGEQGLKAAFQMQKKVAATLGIEANNIGVASTGVIGEQLPMDVIENGIEQLNSEPSDAYSFHQAILTTDLVTKEITVTETINGELVTMSGVAKGSGMIHPNMATMLSFITTDATIDGKLLQELLKEVVDSSYNQITVDGDTSTNDMVISMANGCSGCSEIIKESDGYLKFKNMFQTVAEALAKKIAKDGEGATKLIEVEVKGSQTILDGRMIAKKVVGSSLVKAAMFGEDPNWGRIICAVGYSERNIDPDTIDVWIGGEQVLKQSTPIAFDENKLHDTLEQDFVRIVVDLNIGNEVGIAWGCDLSYKYVEINACYTT